MASSFRRLSKSKVGTAVMAIVLLAIIVGFAVQDAQNFGSGSLGVGGQPGTLVKIGDQAVTEQEMDAAMQRTLQEARQQNPAATYSAVANQFRTVLNALIDQRTLIAFAEKYGFHLSKRLIDAEIAQIPGTKGLDGKFSDQAYQAFLAQRRLSDRDVRDIIAGGYLQRYLLTPIAANPQVPLGVATPFASMLLESREGVAAIVPAEAFAAGLKPTDAQLQAFYTKNRARYVVPEQRTLRIAAITPASVANVVPSDREIAAYYNENKATYAASSTRSLTQVLVPNQKAAAAIAARARGGAPLAQAAGSGAAVGRLADQSRGAYASAAGPKVADAVFAAAQGALVGPIQSDFGWVVVKVESVKQTGGKTLEQARSEISAKLAAAKRKEALESLVNDVQTAIDEGANFAEAAAAAKLNATTTPLILANGATRANASQRLPQNLAPVIKAGFEIAPNDPPEIVTLPDDQGYALVAPASVVAAAPEPLARIRTVVERAWIAEQSAARAKAAAEAVAARAAKGMDLAEAVKQAGVTLPAPRPIAARRLQLAQAPNGRVPAPLQMLFSLAEGKSRMVADNEGRGYYVVKATKVIPGNALLQPTLITQTQSELKGSVAEEMARQFVAAMQQDLGLERNSEAIAKLQLRLLNAGGQ